MKKIYNKDMYVNDHSIDYKALKEAILKKVRGDRTQSELDKKFGKDYEQVYRWESSKVQMQWNDFVKFLYFCMVGPHFRWDYRLTDIAVDDVKGMIEGLSTGMNQKAFISLTGVSRTNLSKWINGSSQPNVETVFMMMHLSGRRLFPFLETFLQIEEIDCVKEVYRLYSKAREAFIQEPLTLFVSKYLSTTPFKEHPYVPGDLAKAFDITAEREKAIVESLEEIGWITFSEDNRVTVRDYHITTVGVDRNITVKRQIFFNEFFNEYLRLKGEDGGDHLTTFRIVARVHPEMFKDFQDTIQKAFYKLISDLRDKKKRREYGSDIERAIVISLNAVDFSDLAEVRKNSKS